MKAITRTNHKKKILIFSSTYPKWRNDTSPSFVHHLARALSENQEVHALAPHKKSLKTQDMIDGVYIHRFKYAPENFENLAYEAGILSNIRQRPARLLLLPLFVAAQIFSLIRLQKKHQFDVLHAHWLVPQGLTATLIRFLFPRLKVVITAHGSDLELSKHRPIKSLYRWIAKNAQAMTFVSSAMQEKSIAAGINPACSEIIPMGIDTEIFNPDESAKLRKPQIVCVARLIKAKGIDTAISAIYELKQRGILTTLLIIGSGPEEENLKQQALQLDIANEVVLLGQQPQNEIAKILRTSAIFVSASHAEGFGLSVAEAMACGCAVITTDIAAMSDLINENKGRKFPVRDHAALADRIEELLKNPIICASLAAEASSFSLRNFSWRFISDSYATLYERLAKK